MSTGTSIEWTDPTPWVRLMLADCAALPLANKSVDLVFCSPPYEAARTYGIGFDLRGQAWVDWAVVRFLEHLRVCRGLVAWVIAGQTRQYRWSATPALLMAELHRRGVCLRNPPIFHRVGIPGSGGPDWLRADYEWIVCATHGGKLPWSDNKAMGHPPRWAPGGAMSNRLSNGTRVNQWGPIGSAKGMGNKSPAGAIENASRPSHQVIEVGATRNRWGSYVNGEKSSGVRDADGKFSSRKRFTITAPREGVHTQTQGYGAPAIANPGNVIRCKVGGGLMGSRLAHQNEAPFPEALAEFFIRSFCPPGGVVLDPFSGSGTTAAVALRHGRNAIASDIRESQVKLTYRRIAEVRALERAGYVVEQRIIEQNLTGNQR